MNNSKKIMKTKIEKSLWSLVFSLVLTGFLFSLPALVWAKGVDGEEQAEEVNPYEKLKVFSEILSLLQANYVEDIDNDELFEGAIQGMLKTLDPHTAYMPPVSYKEMKVETSGKFGGLGIEISMRDGVLTVVSPIDETPAFKAGILAGDKIIRIEDESTLDMSLTDAVERLRGERGSPVNITVFRKGETQPREFTIVRDIIKVQSVKNKIYNKEIGYVKVRSFTKTTSTDLDKALNGFREKGVSKLILDLRNNPGGLLNQAVEVSDRFLDKDNLIVYTKGRSEDQNMRFTTHDKVKKVDYPMIIIVNGGSASASEIVAGALQDLGRAIILGTPTFGKGSVQTIIPLSDGSALRLTTARYYTPSGRVIQENGIAPDILVEVPVKTDKKVEVEKETKDGEEKSRFRKFLREKDLKQHLKGKESQEFNSTPLDTTEDVADEEDSGQSDDLEKDLQLREAVALLSGWDVMSQVLNAAKSRSISTQ